MDDGIREHVQRWKGKYASAKTPHEAFVALKSAGYATASNYVEALDTRLKQASGDPNAIGPQGNPADATAKSTPGVTAPGGATGGGGDKVGGDAAPVAENPFAPGGMLATMGSVRMPGIMGGPSSMPMQTPPGVWGPQSPGPTLAGGPQNVMSHNFNPIGMINTTVGMHGIPGMINLIQNVAQLTSAVAAMRQNGGYQAAPNPNMQPDQIQNNSVPSAMPATDTLRELFGLNVGRGNPAGMSFG